MKKNTNIFVLLLFILINNFVLAFSNPILSVNCNGIKVKKSSNCHVVNTTSLFKLNLFSSSQTFNQIAIGYIAGATLGIDNQIDAIPFVLSNTMVSSLINNVDYVIQGRPLPFVNSDVVPLGFRNGTAGNYTFSTEAFQGVFASNQNIYIRDNLIGITHNIKQSPYHFTAALGVFNSRFEIVYQSTLENTVCINTTTWANDSWSNNPPNTSTAAIISSNFSAIADLTACSLTITGAATVNVSAGVDFNIINEVTVASTASLTFENSANLLQTSGSINVGNITFKTNTTIQRLAYTYWSSPVLNQNLLTFSPETVVSRFYNYNESNNTFLTVASPSTTQFTPTLGYGIRAPNTFIDGQMTPFAGTFTGIANNGNYNFNGKKVSDGYNLIGNPYPSTILASAFFTTNPSVDVLYFWDNTILNPAPGNNFATRNNMSTVAAASNRTKLPTNFIAAGQGFFVKLNTASIINFTNDMRSSENSSAFFRNAVADKSLFKLNLQNTTQNFNQIAIGYCNLATNGVDNQIDALPFGDSPTMVSSLINNNGYVIQGRSLPFANTDVVSLSFKTDVAGNYSFSTEAFEGVFANNQNIFIKDNFVGTTHNIKQSPYNFTTNVGTFNSRFKIVYQSNLSIENPNFNENSVFVFQKDGAIHINSGAIKMKNVAIFDLRGRKISEINNVNSSKTEINLNILQQVLLVKITTLNNEVVTKKIIF